MASVMKWLARQPKKPLLQRFGFGTKPLPRKPVRAVSANAGWTRLLNRFSRQPGRALTDGWSESTTVLFATAWAAVMVFAIGWCMTAPNEGADAVLTAANVEVIKPVDDTDPDVSGENPEGATPSIEEAVSDAIVEARDAAPPQSILAAVTETEPSAAVAAPVPAAAEPPVAEAAPQPENREIAAPAIEPGVAEGAAAPAEAPPQISWAEEASLNAAALAPDARKETEEPAQRAPESVSGPAESVDAVIERDVTPAPADKPSVSVTVVEPQYTAAEPVEPDEALEAAQPEPSAVANAAQTEVSAAPEFPVATDAEGVSAEPVAVVLRRARSEAVLEQATRQYLAGEGSQAIQTLDIAMSDGEIDADALPAATHMRRGLRQLRVLYQDAQQAAQTGDVAAVARAERLMALAESNVFGFRLAGQESVYLARIRSFLAQQSAQ